MPQLCAIGEKLSDAQLKEFSNPADELALKQELSKHFANCKNEGCIITLQNRVRIGLQDMSGHYKGVSN